MKSVKRVLFLAVILTVGLGCEVIESEEYTEYDGSIEIGESESPVVYGHDNRLDVYAHPDASLKRIGELSSAVLMEASTINASNPNAITFNAPPLSTALSLCPGERFYNDITAGYCSATLISDNLVLTAGHCISAAECPGVKVVFNYRRASSGTMQTVTSKDVFQCAEVVVDDQSHPTNFVDYAIIRLDRSATPRFTPAPLRNERSPMGYRDRVAAIGAPYGIPTKIDSGGRVRDARADTLDYFIASTDTFGDNVGDEPGDGNAGSSGIYELNTYLLSGINNNGYLDYIWDNAQQCHRVNAIADHEGPGERMTYIGKALDGLCAAAPADPLCAPTNGYAYLATATNSAQVNTVNRFVYLDRGQTIKFGTTGLLGASGTGDTYLRLYSPNGAQVAYNDDFSGYLSRVTYTAASAGLYQMRAGCYGSSTCSGNLRFETQGSSRGISRYAATNTASATQNTYNVTVRLNEGEKLEVGTCGIEGAAAAGDTYLRVYSGSTEVAYNDDACGGLASKITYVATSTADLSIHSGCYSGGSCEGTLSYRVIPWAQWTTWMDQDDPSGGGDFEYLWDFTLDAYPTCEHPIGAACQRVNDGRDWKQLGEVMTCNPTQGAVCINAQQADGICYDYRVSFVCPDEAVKTAWMSRDNPYGSGDGEYLSALIAEGYPVCVNPIGIECRRISDRADFTQTGETTRCLPSLGAECINARQSDGQCDDYEVRFVCPAVGYWTGWLNRDTPSGGGDNESLALHQQEGAAVCKNPIGVQCRRLSGDADWTSTGEVMTCTPSEGSICVNSAQSDGVCDDYKVRFYCGSMSN